MDIRIATVDEAATVTAIVNRAFVVEAFFKIGDRTSREDVLGLMRDGGECERRECSKHCQLLRGNLM